MEKEGEKGGGGKTKRERWDRGGGKERMMGREYRQLQLCDVYIVKAAYILVTDDTSNGGEGAVGLMLWVGFLGAGVPQPVAQGSQSEHML